MLPNWLDVAIKEIDKNNVQILSASEFEPNDASLGLFYDKRQDVFSLSEPEHSSDGDFEYNVRASDFKDDATMYHTFYMWKLWGKDENFIFIQLPEQHQQRYNRIFEGAYGN